MTRHPQARLRWPRARLRWRAAALAAACGAALALGGCWGIAPTEKAGLVTLLAIDAAPGGGYLVTADILSVPGLPPPSPAAGAGSGASPVLVRHASAPTVFAAIRDLGDISHLSLDFTHLEGVIVSEQLASAGLATPLDSLVRSPEVSEVAPWLLVSRESSAAGILDETQAIVPDPGEVLDNTAESSRQQNPTPPTHLWEFLERLQLQGDEPTTAGVGVDASQGTGTGAAFRLSGVALFRAGRLVGWLDGGAAMGWTVATRRTAEQTIAVPAPGGGTFTVDLHRVSRHVRVRPGALAPAIDLDLGVSAQLSAVDGGRADFWKHPALVEAVERAAAAVLTGDVAAAVSQAQTAGADAFSLGEYARLQDHRYWLAHATTWSTSGFPNLTVTPQIKVHVADVGVIFCPLLGAC